MKAEELKKIREKYDYARTSRMRRLSIKELGSIKTRLKKLKEKVFLMEKGAEEIGAFHTRLSLEMIKSSLNTTIGRIETEQDKIEYLIKTDYERDK